MLMLLGQLACGSLDSIGFEHVPGADRTEDPINDTLLGKYQVIAECSQPSQHQRAE
jgi:hypothetical protein